MDAPNGEWQKPLPHRTPLALPFWEGTRAHQLVLQRCAVCAAYRFPPQVLCRACLAEAHDWVPTSGRATVYSFVVQHRPATPAFTADVPYVVAAVALEEGPLMLTNIVGCAPADVTVGMAVEVAFTDATDEITLYPFRPR
jgi:uncharacterized OB-fold protein